MKYLKYGSSTYSSLRVLLILVRSTKGSIQAEIKIGQGGGIIG